MTLAKKEPEIDVSGSSYNTPDWQSSQWSSPRRDLFTSSPHRSCCLSGDSYCLFISIHLDRSSDETTAGVSIPAGPLMYKIIWLYLSPIITDITQIVILSNTDFLVYKGRWSKGEGMTYDEAGTHIRSLVGSQDWVRFPVVIRATLLTLGKGKAHITDAKEFIQTLTLTRVQQDQQIVDDAEPTSQERAWWLAYWWCLEGSKELWKPRSVYVTPDSSPARKQHPDKDPIASVSKHLGLEPSEGSFGLCSLSDSDPQTNTGNDLDTSRQMTTYNRDRHRDRACQWDRRKGERGGWKKTNQGKLSLPIFSDLQKDDAISYDDWHCKVDTLLQRGHSPKKIKMAVLDTLEGRPKRTTQVANTDGKGRIGQSKLYKILDVLENSYGRSVTY